MLDIAFDELPRSGAQDMVPSDLGHRVDEGHHILQLVAESVGTARLIKRGAAPKARAEYLVKQLPV